MKNYLAGIPLAPSGGFRGFGPLGLEGGEDPYSIFNKVLSGTIGIITAVAFIWFIFLLLIGAYGIMQSGGDKQALEKAHKQILNGLYGVVIVIAAIFIIDLFGFLIGIPDILNPGEFIRNLGN